MSLLKRWRPEVAAGSLPVADSLSVLAPWTQVLLGVSVATILLLTFLLTKSLVPIAAILGIVLLWVVLRNPVYSILGFIAVNVIITLRPHGELSGGAPTSFDLVLGLFLAATIAYWVFKIRVIEWRSLSISAAQVSLMLFFVWAILVTIGGIIANNNPTDVALREILNLLPLLIIPVLYAGFIKPGSKAENWIFASVLVSGLAIVVGNIFQMRNNIARAYYLYQTGRGSMDTLLAPFIIVLLVSYLMSETNAWHIRGAILLLLAESVALAISMTRNMYFATPFAGAIVLWLGTREERRKGMRRLAAFGGLATLGVFIATRLSRLLSLLVTSEFYRLISTDSLGRDLSMRMKFAEWSGELHAIQQSPVLGHGFGASFRIFDIVRDMHVWMSFSHSSYLYIIFKTGIIGGLLFFIPFFTFLYKGFKLSRLNSLTQRARIVARGCFACLIILLFSAFLGPVLDAKTDLMWVGLIWGYFLALERQIHMKATSLDTSLRPI